MNKKVKSLDDLITRREAYADVVDWATVCGHFQLVTLIKNHVASLPDNKLVRLDDVVEEKNEQ